MAKTIEEIDVYKRITQEEFMTLFSPIPLLENEKKELELFYYDMYCAFLDSEVKPDQAWLAVKNVFIVKNPQIGTRL